MFVHVGSGLSSCSIRASGRVPDGVLPDFAGCDDQIEGHCGCQVLGHHRVVQLAMAAETLRCLVG